MLEAFCAHLGSDPDAIVAAALADKGQRADFMRRLKEFVRQGASGTREAHDRENVVRSFFIHNGARVVVRPYPE